ncbi:MAG: lamin tail domain-containing protein [Deltaproteobacteria bacterium]|nr:lamin tail domain-containing protein [Deltaproteobacteria bacterium]
MTYADGDAPAGASYGRLPDGAGAWRTLRLPTPGAPNAEGPAAVCGDLTCDPDEDAQRCPADCVSCGDGRCDAGEVNSCVSDCPPPPPARALRLNEVVAAGAPDWVELYNPGDAPVALSGYALSDDPALPRKGALTAGEVPARGYLRVDVSDEGLGFKLSGDEQALLTSPDGVILDLVDWAEGDAPLGASYGRAPDGDGAWRTLTAPTPGAPNAP